MLNPGGQPNVAFDKAAMTRFNNSQRKASRAGMVGNPAAQQSIRKQTSKVASNKQGAIQSPQSLMQPSPLPTGGTALPVEAAQGFDPAVFMQSKINEFVGHVKLENFLQSPRVKDAMESIRLKNIMNADNPNYHKSRKTLFDQVVDKIGMRDANL